MHVQFGGSTPARMPIATMTSSAAPRLAPQFGFDGAVANPVGSAIDTIRANVAVLQNGDAMLLRRARAVENLLQLFTPTQMTLQPIKQEHAGPMRMGSLNNGEIAFTVRQIDEDVYSMEFSVQGLGNIKINFDNTPQSVSVMLDGKPLYTTKEHEQGRSIFSVLMPGRFSPPEAIADQVGGLIKSLLQSS